MGCGRLSTAQILELRRAERRRGCPAGVLAGVAGERGSERGANWCQVKERVTGRFGGMRDWARRGGQLVSG